MYKVAIVGATGAVGEEMINILEERDFPISRILPLASERSIGRTISYKGQSFPVEVLNENSLDGIDIALFSAGSEVTKKYAPNAGKKGTLIIDNSPAYRMDNQTPLIIPEVNADEIKKCPRNIIANPNCVVAELAVALHPIHKVAKIKRVVVSTYQAASGAGRMAIDELTHQTADLFAGREPKHKIFVKSLAFNCIPTIGSIQKNGYTSEEEKIHEEIPKLFNAPNIKITSTAVRVPVFCGHSSTVAIETEKKISVQDIKNIFTESDGIILSDDYISPRDIAGKDPVYVSRIREDKTVPNGLMMWIVSDNLRKGAALNAVQIAELAVQKGLLNK